MQSLSIIKQYHQMLNHQYFGEENSREENKVVSSESNWFGSDLILPHVHLQVREGSYIDIRSIFTR